MIEPEPFPRPGGESPVPSSQRPSSGGSPPPSGPPPPPPADHPEKKWGFGSKGKWIVWGVIGVWLISGLIFVRLQSKASGQLTLSEDRKAQLTKQFAALGLKSGLLQQDYIDLKQKIDPLEQKLKELEREQGTWEQERHKLI